MNEIWISSILIFGILFVSTLFWAAKKSEQKIGATFFESSLDQV